MHRDYARATPVVDAGAVARVARDTVGGLFSLLSVLVMFPGMNAPGAASRFSDVRSGLCAVWFHCLRVLVALLLFGFASSAMAAVCYVWNAGPAGASSYTLSTQTTAGFQNCDPFYGDFDTGGIYSDASQGTSDIPSSTGDGSKLTIDTNAVLPEDVVVFTPSSTTTQTQWTFKLFGSDGSSRDLVINRERGGPAISGISPSSRPSATGGSVTITGNNFVNNATVTFGGTAGTGVTVVSPTQVNVTAPPHAVGTVDVVLTTSGGSATATSAFTFLPLPVVTSVSPTQGSTGGGNSVTINGTDLGGATGVTIGGNAAAITSNTASQITVTAPGGSAGTVDVLVTTNGGQSAISASAKYAYVNTPTVASVTQNEGPLGGGNTVTITGTNFVVGSTTVSFGSTAATGVVVNSTTSLTATVPAGAAGTVDVSVTTAAGTSPPVPGDRYTYLATPTLSAVSPSAGPTGGSTSVALTGTGFTAGMTVTFGGTSASGLVVNSATSASVNAPAHAAGSVDVVVSTGGGSVTLPSSYKYVAAPTVTGVLPPTGSASGGTPVTINGTNLSDVTDVRFGATSAAFTVTGPGSITTTSPGGTGTVDITVTSPGGTSATGAADQFTYIPGPTVSSISPTTGPAAGGTSVTITGANFTAASTVAFGSTAATSVTFMNSTTLNATAPAGTGTADVRVTTANGTSPIVSGDVFTYIGAPTITSISPTNGPGGGGTNVTINGTGFTGATAVTFGGTAATTFNVTSSTSMTAQAPAGTGTVDIRVTTPGGTTAMSAADQFTYVGAPTVTSISPTAGPTAGGTTVTINGTNLSNVSGVKFGATNAISFSGGTGTQLTAISPAGAAGVLDVTVTTPGGTSATGAGDRFTYVAAPTAAPVSVSVPFNSAAAPVNVDLSSGASAVTLVSVGTGPLHGQATVSSNTSLTYRPTAGYSGGDSFTYTLTNVGGTSTAGTVTVTVGTPTITYSPPTTLQASVGALYSSTALAVASGGSTPYSYSITTGHLPQGLTLDSNGTLHGTPTSVDVQDITVTATDNATPGGPYSATSGTIRITTVAPTIAFSTTSLTAVPSGTAYNRSVTASGGTAPYSYSIVGGSLPPGVTMNTATGAITGDLKNVGSFTFTLQAKDANQFPAQVVLTLQVTAPVLAVTTTALTDAAVGTSYTQTLAASGGVTPYTFTATGLPSGLSVTGNAISGTPTQTGTFTVVVRMTDSTAGVGAPYFVDKTLSLTVNASPMTLSPSTLTTPIAGQGYTQTLSASGGTAPYRYAVTSGTLPTGLTLDPATGILSGTPRSTGASNFTVTATDSSTGPGTPLTVAKAFAFNITGQVASAPAVQTQTLSNAPLRIRATANAVGAPFTRIAIATPPQSGTAVVEGEDIVYTPTANTNGDVAFTYTLTNAVGTSAPISVTVSVKAVPVTAASLEASVAANGTADLDITSGATGGPFTGANLISISPPNAGTVTIISTAAATPAAAGVTRAATLPTGNTYTLRFVPAAAFAGMAVITYTISNANATSAPGTVKVTVAPRKDPSTDPDVTGLIGAQVEAARRFATTQIGNYNQRLEALHGKGRAPSSNGLNVVLPSSDRGSSRDLSRCQDIAGITDRDACLRGEVSPTALSKAKSLDVRDKSVGASGVATGESGDGPNLPGVGAGDDQRFAYWTAGTVDFGFANTAAQRSGFKFTTGGVTMGADYRFSDQFSLGAGVGYGHDATDIGSSGTRSTGDSYSGAIYASFRPMPTLFVDAVAGYGTLSFDSRRWVVDANDFATGKRKGQQFFGSLSAGYEYRTDDWLFSPYGRLTASRSTLDQYSESGAGLNALTYFKQNVNTLSGTLGVRAGFAKATHIGTFSPYVRVELQHDFNGQSLAGLAYADIASSGPVYFVPGSPYGSDRVQVGAGTKLRTGTLVFGLDYSVTTGMGGLQQGFRLTFTAPF